jgi:hypothetical protein
MDRTVPIQFCVPGHRACRGGAALRADGAHEPGPFPLAVGTTSAASKRLRVRIPEAA